MAFVFRLEKYLKLKKIEEDRLKIELGKLLVRKNNLISELDRNVKETMDASIQSINILTHQTTLSRIIPFFIGIDMSKWSRLKREKEIKELEKAILKMTQDFTKIRGKVKSLENIRKNRYQEYKRTENKKEQNNLEELYSISNGHTL